MLAVFGILTVNVLADRYQFKRGIVINHTVEAFFRGLLLIAASLLFADSFWQFVALMLMSMAIYWLCFDYAMNVFVLKMPALYVGKTAAVDKWFRKMFPRDFESALLVAKITLLCIAVTVCLTVNV